MADYLKVVYPQIAVGASHARPSRPDCCMGVHEISVTWDIHSANDEDRAEYWEVDPATVPAEILSLCNTAAEVETAVYGVDGKAAWIIANPAPADPVA